MRLGTTGECGRDPASDIEDLGAQFMRAAIGDVRVESSPTGETEEAAGELMEGELLAFTRRRGASALGRWLVRAFEAGQLQPPRSRGRRGRLCKGQAEHRLDLTEKAIHEASLFDYEAEEWGEVQSPRLRTEDTRSHWRVRAQHASAQSAPLRDA